MNFQYLASPTRLDSTVAVRKNNTRPIYSCGIRLNSP